jgi:hypothetical protein
MANVICGHCGASNAKGLRFCEKCDGFLEWEGTPEDPEPEAEPAPPPAVRPAATRPAPAARPGRAPASEPALPFWQQAVTTTQPTVTPPARARNPVSTQNPARPPSSRPIQAPARSASTLPVPLPAPPTPATPATPAALVCATCGTPNDHGRRFCRHCGDWIVTPTARVRTPPGTVSGALKRRWRGDGGPYTSSLTRSTIAFRTLAGVAVVAVVAAILGLAGLHPIRRVTDQVAHIRGSGRIDPTTVAAAANPPTGLAGRSAGWAVDNIRERGWATRWTAPTAGDPKAACRTGSATAAGATANTLILKFQVPTDIREIGIEAGLVAAADRTNRWQPRTLELHWSDGRCQPLNLKNIPGLQRFGVDAQVVTGVTIAVVAGYAPPSAGSDELDLGEVTFWQR